MVTGMADAAVVNGASKATAFFNYHIGSRQNPVAKNFLARSREIGPIAALRRLSLGNNAGDDFIAFPEFDSLAGTQPSLQSLGVTKLANVYTGHGGMVSQYVTHCQPCVATAAPRLSAGQRSARRQECPSHTLS